MWLVPLGQILAVGGLSRLTPYAYASTAIAAFISPLIFGSMADRHASPVKVLRGLSLASAASLALASWCIANHGSAGIVLSFIQLYALCSVPTNSLASTIILGGLSDSQRQFGPVRAAGTFGWMCGCWAM